MKAMTEWYDWEAFSPLKIPETMGNSRNVSFNCRCVSAAPGRGLAVRSDPVQAGALHPESLSGHHGAQSLCVEHRQVNPSKSTAFILQVCLSQSLGKKSSAVESLCCCFKEEKLLSYDQNALIEAAKRWWQACSSFLFIPSVNSLDVAPKCFHAEFRTCVSSLLG